MSALKNYALLKVSPRLLKKVVKYLEGEMGLEIIGPAAEIKPNLITYYHGMGSYDIDRILALRTALYNDAPSIEPET